MIRPVVLAPLLAALLALLAPGSSAQSIHLPSPHKITVERGKPLLTFDVLDSSYAGTTVAISDDQLILGVPGTPPELIPLGNQTLLDIENAVEAKHEGKLGVTVRYALRSARLLEESDDSLVINSGMPAVLRARGGEPEVFLGFGVQLAMGPHDAENSGGVLNQTGFQLDLAGVHQLAAYKDTIPSAPSIYFTGCIGLTSDQELVVEPEQGATPDPSGQLGAALRQADQISLTAQLDHTWRLWSPRQELGVYAGFCAGYAQLEPIAAPLVAVNDSTRLPAEQVFDEDVVERTRLDMSRILPLREIDVGAMLRFVRTEKTAFYVGAGVQRRKTVIQGVWYTFDADRVPDSASLQGLLRVEDRMFWRGLVDIRLSGVLDIRVDAVARMNQPGADPLLRLVVARDFPLTK